MTVYEEIANKIKAKRDLYLQKQKIKTYSKAETNEMNISLDIECHCRKLLHNLKMEGKYFQTAVTLFYRYRLIYANQSIVLLCLSLKQELQRNTVATFNAIDRLTYLFNELSVMLTEIDISTGRRITMCLEEFQRFLDLCKYVLEF